jgi:hypothetical protein
MERERGGREGRKRDGRERESPRVMFRVDWPSAQPKTDTVVGAHLGRAGQGLEIDSQRVS